MAGQHDDITQEELIGKHSKKQGQHKQNKPEKPNPYEMDMSIRRLLRKHVKQARRKPPSQKERLAQIHQHTEELHLAHTGSDDIPGDSLTGIQAQGDQELTEDPLLQPPGTSAGQIAQDKADPMGKHVTLPQIDDVKRNLKNRYSSASMKSIYFPEDDRRKRSAATRKTTSSEMTGGYQYTFTGVQKVNKDNVMESVERLTLRDAQNVPDAKRVIPRDVTSKCGLTMSFQWTAGGQRCHGFMW